MIRRKLSRRSRRQRAAAVATAAAALVAGLALAPTGASAAAAAGADGPDPACPWVGSTAPVNTRTAQVLARMTLDEKIAMVHGTASGAYTGLVPGNSRLCVPALKVQDGPTGVRMDDTTQLPAAVGLAASFDPAVAESYGAVIGAEDRTKGVDVDLGPTINIVRDPRWGRAFESYSEDPYLAGQIGAADIDGIQGQGVMAQVKHWAVYNQETNRNTPSDNVVIDDRSVREIYTSAFGTVVEKANPSSAMCSYSSVNGTYACESAYLDSILKDDFGFQGFITSDWGGTHSTVASANAGMDLQMPDDSYFGAALKTAVQNGQVPQSRVDDMVTRILREQFRFGLFEHPSKDTPGAVASTPAHLDTAKKAAEAGTVLLKNAGGVLPLNAAKVRSIAVVGDGAGPDTMTAGGGSASVSGTGTVTPYDGIKARAGSGTTVSYAQGSSGPGGALPAIDASYLTPPSGTGHGLQGDYYTNQTLSGDPAATRTDPQVNFVWNGKAPAQGVSGGSFSAKWTGTITPPATGAYTFGITSDDGSRLFVDGTQVIDNWRDQGSTTRTAQVDLTAGKPVQVEMDYYQSGGGATASLGWTPPGAGTPLDQAVALAATSDVAVVYADNAESEGSDLANIDLPADQNKLISAVAAVNPNTVVVLNTGSAVTMPWLDQVKGVLEAWYPGQQAGNAIAELLFGDVNPSAKLPVTFPTSLDQVPASTAQQFPGVGGTVDYSEGLNVGYRWYDTNKVTPLFPFGYGLSYTSFGFSNLRVGSRLSEDGTLQASVEVTNTGSREGAEVAQLYLTDPSSTGEPARQLKGFQRVDLQPHQSKRVAFRISARDASYWSTDAQAWTLAAGRYSVQVGDSSRHLPLSGAFQVTRTTGPRFTQVAAPATATAGATLSVRTTFTNESTQAVSQATTKLTVPTGWTKKAVTAATFRKVPAGESATTTWQVKVPVGAEGGAAALAATTSYSGSHGLPPGTGEATVALAYADLAAARDTVGTTDDADQAPGDLDGKGYSFSAQALASVGITPGSRVTAAGTAFTWPDVPAGQADAVTTRGQLVTVSGTGSALSFLTVGTNGAQTGKVTVTYTDGSTSTATLKVSDWYSNAAGDGCTLVATTAHWNRPAGSTNPANQKVSLYAASVPLTSGKSVRYVTLPVNPELHVFATAVS
ncbi:glycoside hydrolase family 3 C-terminal domain-containing protein [Streptomyces sp. V4-01]|uniref:Glycoside hydrolase family 3 C-terminal domain-containing protein n=1 Tax=Actinacidiphila polyblastidii TaxID=3110430 RepID=A0ABU7P3K3_9ACTN|nr:glycoside hydrolase family 3 C-terminal domain-containing protein [Streptomyces sp. V4-01]